jgi:putative DNA primase/helicase
LTPTLDAALAWHQAGCSVVRVATDGTKRPLGAWKQYQATAADTDALTAWFTGGHPGVGVVTGAVSGNLEMLELEGRAMAVGLMAQIRDLAEASGLDQLLDRVLAGYAEFTPTGGFHLYYRVDGPVAGNTKLARRPATADELAENPVDKVKVLVETRGEGGFVVVAPSAGPVHPTGKAWVAVPGRTPADIPTVTADERDALHILTGAFDQMPDDEPVVEPRRTSTPSDVLRPGDDYNARTSWADILGPHGWTPVHRWGGVTYWRRPGKNDGISATTGRNDADNLYVFTTSTEFDSERPYSKFAAYTLLEHRGDYAAAARALRALGYGDPEPPRPTTVHEDLAPATGDTAPTSAPDGYTLTDDGNALRLVDTHGRTMRYVHERSTWIVWNGTRWVWDNEGVVLEHARQLARDLPADTRGQQRHRSYSLSARGIGATERLARTDRRVVASLAQLDARPYELNTPAGAVDLRTGQLLPADPGSLHTRTTTVVPDFDTTPTRWLAFLADTFAGDPDMAPYVQRLLGLSVIGTFLEQVLPFAYGSTGANGKTTLLEVAERLLGTGDTGYAMSAPSDLLLKTAHQGHPTEIARLAGARLVLTSELEEGERFAQARVKKLTGGDTLTGRFMGQDFFDFRPTHTIWLLANHQPAASSDEAFWRRLRLIPFVHQVPKERRDPNLQNRLVEDEGPAILAWIITGAVDYLAHGLQTPASVATATETYATDQDTVARFVADRCQTGDVNAPHLRTRTSDLRAAYETWCRTEAENPVSPKALTQALRAQFGVESDRTKASRYYLGIRLDDTDSHDDLTQSTVHDQPENPSHPSPDPRRNDEGGWSW